MTRVHLQTSDGKKLGGLIEDAPAWKRKAALADKSREQLLYIIERMCEGLQKFKVENKIVERVKLYAGWAVTAPAKALPVPEPTHEPDSPLFTGEVIDVEANPATIVRPRLLTCPKQPNRFPLKREKQKTH